MVAESIINDGEKRKTEPALKLISNDNIIVEIDQKTACQSNVLACMIRDTQAVDDEPLPLSPIDGATLIKIMTWCEYHKDRKHVKRKKGKDRRIQLTTEDMEYLDVDGEEILAIVKAANFLDIPGLLDITTQYIANMAREKTIEEMRTMFYIENDLTKEEERALKKIFWWSDAADV